MEPRIVTLSQKKLIGKRLKMTLTDNKTYQLWHSFMHGRKEILNTTSNDLYALRVYDAPLDVGEFAKEFEKWAAVEVIDFDTIPDNMETYTLQGGLYAVFDYKGLNTDTRIFHYIFATWLPNSDYSLDHRVHFEVLGAKYKNGDPESEEEIWVPVRLM
ncbi:MAG: GyrI-like domain-containing protein [Bacteroidetes bacterium]|nr:GyrI-like domain-containing protein [Bacteroidota bacterium]